MAHTYSHLFGTPDHRPALLHRVRPLGPAGHGAVPVHAGASWPASRSRSSTTATTSATSPTSTTSSKAWSARSTACRRRIRTWNGDDARPGQQQRALPPLQHRQPPAGRAAALHRGAGAVPGHARPSWRCCRCSPATCPTPRPTSPALVAAVGLPAAGLGRGGRGPVRRVVPPSTSAGYNRPEPACGAPFPDAFPDVLSHLDRLEAESLHILREVAAEFRNPVMLYSIGKDSTVLLHLLKKAFHPARPPIPLLHVDTTWKFREMIAFRDRVAAESDVDLRVHINPEGVAKGIGPVSHGATVHTDVMKTQALKQALDAGKLRRRDRRRPPRRGEVARQGARVLVPQRAAPLGPEAASARSCGTCTTPASTPARACACSRCRTGPSSTSGCTSTARRSRWCRCISPRRGRWWSATAA